LTYFTFLALVQLHSPSFVTCNPSNNSNIKTRKLYEERGCYEETCMVVVKILNFEGLNVAMLVINTKFLNQINCKINQGFMSFE
jgi:hypothetical protein